MGTGRKKIEIKPISNMSQRRVTFSKRRKGLFKKIAKICDLTGCKAFALAFSPSGTPFMYGDVALAESIGISSVGSGVIGGVVGECCTTSYSGAEGSEVGDVGLNPWMVEGSVLPLLLEGPIGSEDGQSYVDQIAPPPPLPTAVEELSPLPLMIVEESSPQMAVEGVSLLPLMAVEESSPFSFWMTQESDLNWDFGESSQLMWDDLESLPMWAVEEPMNFDLFADSYPLH